jgi:hypothetical protein
MFTSNLSSMLKKKVMSLVEKNRLGEASNFEVITDSNAALLIGGEASCPSLTTCGTYNGDCSNLTGCGTYNVPPPCSGLQST